MLKSPAPMHTGPDQPSDSKNLKDEDISKDNSHLYEDDTKKTTNKKPMPAKTNKNFNKVHPTPLVYAPDDQSPDISQIKNEQY